MGFFGTEADLTVLDAFKDLLFHIYKKIFFVKVAAKFFGKQGCGYLHPSETVLDKYLIGTGQCVPNDEVVILTGFVLAVARLANSIFVVPVSGIPIELKRNFF